jgi:hypothetical protein
MFEYLQFVPQSVSVLTAHSGLPLLDTQVKILFVLLAGFIHYNSLCTPILGWRAVDLEEKHGSP